MIKNSIFKNIYVIKLAKGDINSIANDLQKAKKCKVKSAYRFKAMIALSEAYLDNKNYTAAGKYINILTKVKRYQGLMIEPLYLLYQNSISLGQMKQANITKRKILKLGNTSKSLPLEAVDIIARFKLGEVEVLAKRIEGIKLTFPENKFNKDLKLKLNYLDRFSSKALGLLKVGSGNGIVEAYKILHSTYMKFSDELKAFAPKGKSETYINSFKKGISPLVSTLASKAQDFYKSASKEIYRQQILSPSNHYFTSSLKLDFSLEYLNPKRGVLMDKAGRP